MNAFNTLFKHRVKAGINGGFFNLEDTLTPSLERAAAIADLIEVACEPINQCSATITLSGSATTILTG